MQYVTLFLRNYKKSFVLVIGKNFSFIVDAKMHFINFNRTVNCVLNVSRSAFTSDLFCWDRYHNQKSSLGEMRQPALSTIAQLLEHSQRKQKGVVWTLHFLTKLENYSSYAKRMFRFHCKMINVSESTEK